MTLNDILTGENSDAPSPPPPPGSTTARCGRCGRTEVLGWAPGGSACARCARELYRANIQLAAMLDQPTSFRPPMSPTATRLLIKLMLLAIFSLVYLAAR